MLRDYLDDGQYSTLPPAKTKGSGIITDYPSKIVIIIIISWLP